MTISQRLSNIKDEELLAAFLPAGIVKELVADYQTVPRILAHVCPQELSQLKGIGPIKARQIQYLAELSRRIYYAANIPAPVIRSPKDIADRCLDLQQQNQECFRAIYLTTKNGVICEQTISIGTLNATLVGVREVFSKAIKVGACAVVLLHNHPSGDPEPSQEDIELTKKMVAAGDILDIAVLDHLIIGQGRYVSFKEKGLI